jgi:hypothetical protein
MLLVVLIPLLQTAKRRATRQERTHLRFHAVIAAKSDMVGAGTVAIGLHARMMLGSLELWSIRSRMIGASTWIAFTLLASVTVQCWLSSWQSR